MHHSGSVAGVGPSPERTDYTAGPILRAAIWSSPGTEAGEWSGCPANDSSPSPLCLYFLVPVAALRPAPGNFVRSCAGRFGIWTASTQAARVVAVVHDEQQRRGARVWPMRPHTRADAVVWACGQLNPPLLDSSGWPSSPGTDYHAVRLGPHPLLRHGCCR